MAKRITFHDKSGLYCWFDPAKAKSWQSEATWDGKWELLYLLTGGKWVKQWHWEGSWHNNEGQPVAPPEEVTEISEDEALAWFDREGRPWPEELDALAQSRNLTASSGQEPKPSGTVKIDRWCDLGIGVQHEGSYVAFVPCPQLEAVVHPTQRPALHLVGGRWYEVLKCLANCPDGRTVKIRDLIGSLGYHIKGAVSTDKDEVSPDQARFNEGLREKRKRILNKVKNAMADLGRLLRKQISTTDRTPPFQTCGESYQAAFVTAYLLADDEGKVRFGRQMTES